MPQTIFSSGHAFGAGFFKSLVLRGMHFAGRRRIVKRTRLKFNGAIGIVQGIALAVCLACLNQRTPAQEMESLSQMVTGSPNLPLG